MTRPSSLLKASLFGVVTSLGASGALAEMPDAGVSEAPPEMEAGEVLKETDAQDIIGTLFTREFLVKEREARNAVYLEMTSILALNSFALNAERWLTPYLGLSVGVFHDRIPPINLFDNSAEGLIAYGARAQIHLLAGGENHAVEIALGLTPYWVGTMGEEMDWQEGFAFSIPTGHMGYRYQRSDGEGMLVRLGLTLATGQVLGPSLSLGKAF